MSKFKYVQKNKFLLSTSKRFFLIHFKLNLYIANENNTVIKMVSIKSYQIHNNKK